MVKHKNLNAIISTEGGNNYYVSRSIPQVLLMHPVLKHLVALKEEGKLEEWLNNQQPNETGEIKIEDGIYASPKDIRYYCRYLQFLEEKKYFAGVKKYDMGPTTYSAPDVKRALANTSQIVFEVTEACNLNCKYCGFGEFYSGFDNRRDRTLDLDTAVKVLDYMVDLFESPLNRKYHKKIALSFYGGEPLLNMAFIKEMVHEAKLRKLTYKRFYFSLTTNGVLLDRHMDFLAANDFSILISLDGNEKNNGYRLFPDGSSSFETVYKNILKIRKKYPDYFKRSVYFISVLHDKNSSKEVSRFFNREFQKTPLMSQINSIGIKPEKKAEFDKLFNLTYSDVTPQDLIADTKDKSRILDTPFVRTVFKFLRRYSGFLFGNYDRLILNEPNPWHVCTGTCHPFEKKIFITANGNILPCERILHSYSFGTVDKNGVHLDFKETAETYNRFFKKLMPHCNKCVNSDSCPFCIFTLDMHDENPVCENIMNEKQFKENLSSQLSILEEIPRYYPEIMKNYQVN